MKSSEIYLPATKERCPLPQFSEERLGHSQDGALTCGGKYTKTCVTWNPLSGTWKLSHTLTGTENRMDHVSWETASGVYLIGGYYTKSRWTSERVNKDGSVVESFRLKYETR